MKVDDKRYVLIDSSLMQQAQSGQEQPFNVGVFFLPMGVKATGKER